LRDDNHAEAERLEDEWYANADRMAEAFSEINPAYDREELRRMLHSHLDMTSNEVAMRLAKDYVADVQAFDRVEQQAINMADYFARGIMRQFP